jgi:hypothetical protein
MLNTLLLPGALVAAVAGMLVLAAVLEAIEQQLNFQ